MLKPFGGLKKIFSPKTALKPFKAMHKALGPKKVFGALKPRNPIKAMGSVFGGGNKNKRMGPTERGSAVPRPAGGNMASRMMKKKAPPMEEGM